MLRENVAESDRVAAALPEEEGEAWFQIRPDLSKGEQSEVAWLANRRPF
jgi:hypothetical protein